MGMNTDARKQKILTKNGDFKKGEFDRHKFFEIRTSPPLLSKKCSNFTLSPPKNLKIINGRHLMIFWGSFLSSHV